jgi:hypothetical protein
MKYIFLFIISSFPFVNISYGQLKLTYTYGITSNSFASYFSNPITFNGKNCLKVNAGISVFISSNSGDFSENCKVDLPYNNFEVITYPNPANDYTIIKFNKYINSGQIFQLKIIDEVGKTYLIKEYSEDQFQNSGCKLELNEFKSGILYILLNSKIYSKYIKLSKL